MINTAGMSGTFANAIKNGRTMRIGDWRVALNRRREQKAHPVESGVRVNDATEPRRVVLVFGKPNNGKTTLAKGLAKRGFHAIETDDTYVAFIQTTFPELFFTSLRHYIAQHYQMIFRLDGTRLKAWHDHLVIQILDAAHAHAAVVVEGFLLSDCRDTIALALSDSSIRSFEIMADQFRYFAKPQALTIDDVSVMGRPHSLPAAVR